MVNSELGMIINGIYVECTLEMNHNWKCVWWIIIENGAFCDLVQVAHFERSEKREKHFQFMSGPSSSGANIRWLYDQPSPDMNVILIIGLDGKEFNLVRLSKWQNAHFNKDIR